MTMSKAEEAALKAYPKMSRISEPHGVIPADNKSHYLGDANEDNRNAFKAGAEWKENEMMAKAIDADCFGFQGAALFSFRLPADKYLVGSKVKVIVIKED